MKRARVICCWEVYFVYSLRAVPCWAWREPCADFLMALCVCVFRVYLVSVGNPVVWVVVVVARVRIVVGVCVCSLVSPTVRSLLGRRLREWRSVFDRGAVICQIATVCSMRGYGCAFGNSDTSQDYRLRLRGRRVGVGILGI